MAPLTVFAETNVRTYVRGPDGQPGLWFLSLDVPRPALALGIRSTYRLPYLWSEMSVQVEGRRVRYRSRRHWPGPLPANNLLTVDVAEAIPPEEIGELEHFLTARCRCFTRILDRWAYVPVEHAAWPLRRAEIVEITESMVIAAGLQTPQGAPLVHYSPHVRARLGLPRFVAE
jgi:uncharacterized protein YqjF (DUF2071 family)